MQLNCIQCHRPKGEKEFFHTTELGPLCGKCFKESPWHNDAVNYHKDTRPPKGVTDIGEVFHTPLGR